MFYDAFSDALDGLDERVTSFFRKCTQPNIKSDWRDEQFGKIKKVHCVVSSVACNNIFTKLKS